MPAAFNMLNLGIHHKKKKKKNPNVTTTWLRLKISKNFSTHPVYTTILQLTSVWKPGVGTCTKCLARSTHSRHIPFTSGSRPFLTNFLSQFFKAWKTSTHCADRCSFIICRRKKYNTPLKSLWTSDVYYRYFRSQDQWLVEKRTIFSWQHYNTWLKKSVVY